MKQIILRVFTIRHYVYFFRKTKTSSKKKIGTTFLVNENQTSKNQWKNIAILCKIFKNHMNLRKNYFFNTTPK